MLMVSSSNICACSNFSIIIFRAPTPVNNTETGPVDPIDAVIQYNPNPFLESQIELIEQTLSAKRGKDAKTRQSGK